MGSVVISGATSGAITLAVPAEAGTRTLTLPATTGTVLTNDISAAGDTSAGDAAAIGYTAAEGLILTGQGSTSDVTIKNDADVTVLSVATGTGNVGIGTTAPANLLQISNASSHNDTYGNVQINYTGTDTANSGLTVKNYGGTSQFMQWENNGVRIGSRIITNSGVGNVVFTAGADSEKMRINSDGRIGIASAGLGAVQVAVVINGQDWFFVCDADDGTDKFRVASSGNVQNANNSYGSTSDIKLKENIVDATPKLADLMRVKIRNYNFKNDPDLKQIGMVAQELETIFPSMVENHKDQDKDGNDLGTTTKSVKYSVFVPMLIKAMQEQQTTIEALEARITALEA